MNSAIFKSLLLSTSLLSGSSFAGDRFDDLKKELSSAECSYFEFISITESDIFESVDSINGSAWMARDGRYSVNLGTDIYLFNGELLYTYSAENEQVVIEKVDPKHNALGAEVSFIIHLDEYYRSKVIQPDREYTLFRLDSAQTSIPDTLQLLLDVQTGRMSRLIYYDENNDRQQILISAQKLYDRCKPDSFSPKWPDGTEIVKLY